MRQDESIFELRVEYDSAPAENFTVTQWGVPLRVSREEAARLAATCSWAGASVRVVPAGRYADISSNEHDEDRWLELRHEPLEAPRRGHYGEDIWARRWRALMESIPPQDFAEFRYPVFVGILRHITRAPSQRDASVAASIVRWLATSCGGAFLEEAAEVARRSGTDRGVRYLMAWAENNRRVSWVNFGRRRLELIVGGPISARDLDVADQVAFWLGGAEGQRFIDECRREVAALVVHARECERMGF